MYLNAYVTKSGEANSYQAVLSARFESLEMGEREREERVVHTVPPGTVEHPADDVISLDASAALEVAQHRKALHGPAGSVNRFWRNPARRSADARAPQISALAARAPLLRHAEAPR
jgi:hypothetical protein